MRVERDHPALKLDLDDFPMVSVFVHYMRTRCFAAPDGSVDAVECYFERVASHHKFERFYRFNALELTQARDRASLLAHVDRRIALEMLAAMAEHKVRI